MILFATIFDGFDGYVARSLKVTSEIGKQLDSLADLVTFGVAPGYLFYHMYLSDMFFTVGRTHVYFGMIIAAIFPICAAYRLARFNVQTTHNYFQGLPSPIAGIVIALFPFLTPELQVGTIPITIFFVIIGLLMVSTIRYSKPQVMIQEKVRGIWLIISFLLAAIILFFLQEWALAIFILLYLISGFVSFIIQLIQVMRL